MSNLEDTVRCAQAGDTLAYEQIVKQFQNMAVGYAFSILEDWHQAEDVAQEAFIAAFYSLPNLRQPITFPSWFRRIVYTHIHRQVRARKLILVSLDYALETVSGIPEPAEAMEAHERAEQIRVAVQDLPDYQRTVILLYYVGEHTQHEIADFLDIPIGTVKSRLHKARKQLKSRILNLMQENLSAQRPSKDDKFTEKVMRLFTATQSNDIEQVKQLLAQDKSLARASGLVMTSLWQAETPALHLAVMHGRKDIIDLLLANGADIEERDPRYHFSALIHAVDLADFIPEYADLKMVEFLLERGAEKDVWACWWLGDNDGVEEWLQKDPSLVNQVGPGPSTMFSFVRGIESAKYLLKYGADPLKPYKTANWGMTTPLRTIAYQGNYAVVRFLLDYLGKTIDVFTASLLGDLAQVQQFITESPASLHVFTKNHIIFEDGLSTLHLAAQGGHAEIIRLLLNEGANINASSPDFNNITPLHLAIRLGQRELIDPLPSLQEMAQDTGVYRMLVDMPKLLLENGADVSIKDSKYGWDARAWAEANHEDETDRCDIIPLLEQYS